MVAVVIVLANLAACLIVLVVQGQVRLELWPFALVWGLLLVPTFLAWTSFVTASYALSGNRYTTYGIGLAALFFTGYRLLTDKMNWVGNWTLWNALRWTDMGVFELDRMALILNRLMVLGLTVFFTVLAVRLFRRRDVDSARLAQRLSLSALIRSTLGLLPYAAVPLALGITLYVQVYRGYEGAVAKKAQKDYWRKNLATWKDSVLPAITAVDIDLELEPAQRWFRVNGTFELRNQRNTPLRQIPFSSGDHWENVRWTMNGKDYQPDNRSHLYVFTPSPELAPGNKLSIGFSFEGKYPRGVSENGKSREEFILPSGVVLTSFRPSIAPVLGYIEEVGVDKDNRYEAKDYPDDFYVGLTEPAFGTGYPFATHLRVSAPAEYTINSVGTLERQEVANGRRTRRMAQRPTSPLFQRRGGPLGRKTGARNARLLSSGPRLQHRRDLRSSRRQPEVLLRVVLSIPLEGVEAERIPQSGQLCPRVPDQHHVLRRNRIPNPERRQVERRIPGHCPRGGPPVVGKHTHARQRAERQYPGRGDGPLLDRPAF